MILPSSPIPNVWKCINTFVIQIICLCGMIGGVVDCSSSQESASEDNNTEDEPSTNLSLQGECYSCTQSLGTGDTCGVELITGNASLYTFTQINSNVTVDINDQIELSGTFSEGDLTLSNEQVISSGAGCDMKFTNLILVATIESETEISGSWSGILTYDVSASMTDDDCGSSTITTCSAIHVVSCTTSEC